MVIVTVGRGRALSDQTCSMNVVVEAVKAGGAYALSSPLCGVMVYVLIFCYIDIGTSYGTHVEAMMAQQALPPLTYWIT